MKQEEILEYNKRCAEFLKFNEIGGQGYVVVPEHLCHLDYRSYYDYTQATLKFHSDWNWIMEVRNKILSINSYSSKGQRFTFSLNATAKFTKNENDKPFKVRVKGVLMSEPRPFIEINSFDEKEAVVQAINQFLIWYNENKTN